MKIAIFQAEIVKIETKIVVVQQKNGQFPNENSLISSKHNVSRRNCQLNSKN